MFNLEEVLSFENELRKYWYQKRTKIHKDPKREKLRDFRKGIKAVHYDNEIKAVRKADYRIYRRQMKHLLKSEQYDLIRKYQKTGGWLTW